MNKKELKNKAVRIDTYPHLKGAGSLEEVLCLATLIAVGQYHWSCTVDASKEHWNSIGQDCSNCPYVERCLASIINE
jgi:hypothetical protein